MAIEINFAYLNTFIPVLQSQNLLETRMINSAEGQIQYVGFAVEPNASTADAVWYILKFSVDSNGFINRQQIPDNGQGFFYVWDDVASYFS